MNLGLHFRVENFQSSKDSDLGNPENNPILDRFAAVRSGRGGEGAVFHPDGTVARTFSQLNEEADRWVETLGEARGGFVGLQMGNSPSWPAVLLGAWRAGCGVVPLDPDLAGERRDRVEKICGILRRVVRRSGELAVEVAGGTQEAARPAADLLKLTSGTTGDPRAVRFSARQLLADCDQVCVSMGIRADDLNYGVISFAHSYGFSNLITPLLCRGVPLVAASDALPRAVLGGLAATGATVFPGVPAHFRTLTPTPPGSLRLRLCVSAGARLAGETARNFFQSWGRKVHSFYGSSECGGICYDAGEDPDVPEGYVGAPLVDVLVEPDGSGPVRVRSAAVGLGYWPEPDAALSEGVFCPADLLEKRQNGYVITGRASDLINVAGRKVNPAEVEAVVRRCPGVSDTVVLGVPASLRGEEVVACVVGTVTEETLRRFCAGQLAPWQCPRRWIFLEEIPVNARGKVSRTELRRQIVGG
jgi:long-chain acyl-CoA synthetase